MHQFLQPDLKHKWIKKIKAKPDMMKTLIEVEEEEKDADKTVPTWFTCAIHWFLCRLNGPFGFITKWPNGWKEIFQNDIIFES